MFIIKDDAGKYLSQYLGDSCDFSSNEKKAITFKTIMRAGRVLNRVTKILPEYVKLTIEPERKKPNNRVHGCDDSICD